MLAVELLLADELDTDEAVGAGAPDAEAVGDPLNDAVAEEDADALTFDDCVADPELEPEAEKDAACEVELLAELELVAEALSALVADPLPVAPLLTLGRADAVVLVDGDVELDDVGAGAREAELVEEPLFDVEAVEDDEALIRADNELEPEPVAEKDELREAELLEELELEPEALAELVPPAVHVT